MLFHFNATGIAAHRIDISSTTEITKHDFRFPLPGNMGIASNLPLPKINKCGVDLSVLNQPSPPITEVFNGVVVCEFILSFCRSYSTNYKMNVNNYGGCQ